MNASSLNQLKESNKKNNKNKKQFNLTPHHSMRSIKRNKFSTSSLDEPHKRQIN